jgi:hypothetical protein
MSHSHKIFTCLTIFKMAQPTREEHRSSPVCILEIKRNSRTSPLSGQNTGAGVVQKNLT